MDRIAGYELIGRMASGGMGDVWRGRHRLLGREAAIKLIRHDTCALACEQVVRAQFEAEARATAALTSPHTVRVFDFGRTDNGDYYYVMELLRGCSLEQLVRRFGPLPCDRVRFLLDQVCHSLAEAHASGLVHGDIKPANVYACRMGLDCDVAKVLDFGLVRHEQERAWSAALALGTPAYMAPESILDPDRIDRRADIYAVGCVAYFLLTGQCVFDASSPTQMLWDHLYSTPVRPSDRTECAIAASMDDLVMACLHKDPRQRPATVEEVRDRLHPSFAEWGRARARRWWEQHLPEYLDTQSLSIESHESSLCRSSDVILAAAS